MPLYIVEQGICGTCRGTEINRSKAIRTLLSIRPGIDRRAWQAWRTKGDASAFPRRKQAAQT